MLRSMGSLEERATTLIPPATLSARSAKDLLYYKPEGELRILCGYVNFCEYTWANSWAWAMGPVTRARIKQPAMYNRSAWQRSSENASSARGVAVVG
jgi:hypothetical protein